MLRNWTNRECARITIATFHKDFAVANWKVAVQQIDPKAGQLASTHKHVGNLLHTFEIIGGKLTHIRNVGKIRELIGR
jgi:hypothetical protein